MQTIRQQITELLSRGEYGARDISQNIGIREKEVYPHLPHIARSVASQKKKLFVEAPVCLSCNYEFETRNRYTRPGRCPRCKSERIREPRYRIV
ncbi:MAG: transcriptional regulator [Desulfobacteraceae bacterium IS3]|nr:MAG: transcriptional regulator [Desulfobacteraceae bacterium IS3]